MTTRTALSEVVEAIGHPQIFDTVLAYLKTHLPFCHAIVVTIDASEEEMRLLAHTGETAERMALEDYTGATHVLDPFNSQMNADGDSVVQRAREIPPPDHNQLEHYLDIGAPIVLDEAETFRYRTKNWYPRMDEVRMKIGLVDAVTLQIALFRKMQLGGFEKDSVGKLNALLPALKAAIQLHCYCGQAQTSGKSRTTGDVSPTPRQLDVFRWWAAGKTLEDIATILGIKRRTVRYHMEKARELYGYSTVQQTAVRIAQDYKLDPLTGSLPKGKLRRSASPVRYQLKRMAEKGEWVA